MWHCLSSDSCIYPYNKSHLNNTLLNSANMSQQTLTLKNKLLRGQINSHIIDCIFLSSLVKCHQMIRFLWASFQFMERKTCKYHTFLFDKFLPGGRKVFPLSASLVHSFMTNMLVKPADDILKDRFRFDVFIQNGSRLWCSSCPTI